MIIYTVVTFYNNWDFKQEEKQDKNPYCVEYDIMGGYNCE